MTVRIEIPFAMPSQNQYQRWHWRKRARHINECRVLVRMAIGSVPGLPLTVPRRAAVTFTRYSSGELDYGNLVGGCKGLLDALRYEGVIHDDSPRWVEERYLQAAAERGGGRTEIVVEYEGDDAA